MTIWTGTLPTITAGGKILGSDIDTLRDALAALSDSWTTYTPTWSSTGTAVAIGNGTREGRYIQVGKFVLATGYILFGSTTTYGTGSYLFTLPVTASSVNHGTGWAQLIDQGTDSGRRAAACRLNTTSNLIMLAGSGGTVTNTVPFTWADTDQIRWTILYEAA